MMIFSLVAMIGLDKCCITSACLQWLCHSGERIVACGPLVLHTWLNLLMMPALIMLIIPGLPSYNGVFFFFWKWAH